MSDDFRQSPDGNPTGRRRLDCNPLWGRDSLKFEGRDGLALLLRVYDDELGGERLHEAEVNDAAVFAGALTFRLLREHRWDEAEAEIRRFMAHPDYAQLDPISRSSFQRQLGFSLLGLGREPEGLSLLWGQLNSADPRARWVAKHDIRNSLGWGPNGLCPVLWRKGMASEALTTFIETVVAQLRNRPPKRRRFARRTSFARLRRHLLKAFDGDLPFRNALRGMTAEEIMDHAKQACKEALEEIRQADVGAEPWR